MKFKTIIILILITLPFLTWTLFDPSVPWKEIENNYITSYEEQISGVSDRTWIPLFIRLRPYHLWNKMFSQGAGTGFPDIDMAYTLITQDLKIVVTLHLFDELVRGITISTDSNGSLQSEKIMNQIKKDHPFLPIRIIIQNANSEDEK